MKESKNVAEEYVKRVAERVKRAQEANDCPSVYSFVSGGKQWTLMLPRSVMAQKRLMHIRNQYLSTGSYEAEEDLMRAIVENVTVDGHTITINDLEYNEIEVIRTAYLDELLLPLSLGGDKAISEYMTQTLGRKE